MEVAMDLMKEQEITKREIRESVNDIEKAILGNPGAFDDWVFDHFLPALKNDKEFQKQVAIRLKELFDQTDHDYRNYWKSVDQTLEECLNEFSV
jgi:hypothetical protein